MKFQSHFPDESTWLWLGSPGGGDWTSQLAREAIAAGAAHCDPGAQLSVPIFLPEYQLWLDRHALAHSPENLTLYTRTVGEWSIRRSAVPHHLPRYWLAEVVKKTNPEQPTSNPENRTNLFADLQYPAWLARAEWTGPRLRLHVTPLDFAAVTPPQRERESVLYWLAATNQLIQTALPDLAWLDETAPVPPVLHLTSASHQLILRTTWPRFVCANPKSPIPNPKSELFLPLDPARDFSAAIAETAGNV